MQRLARRAEVIRIDLLAAGRDALTPPNRALSALANTSRPHSPLTAAHKATAISQNRQKALATDAYSPPAGLAFRPAGPVG